MKFLINIMSCLCICFMLVGCQTTGQYAPKVSEVTFEDGIDRFEAVAIAKDTLINDRKQGKQYKRNQPKIIDDFLVDPYPDYWFISFPTGALDMSFYHYLVVLHKKTGEVFFSDSYVPLKTVDYDWVFAQ